MRPKHLPLNGKPSLEIGPDLMDRINYLCRSIPNEEWSGILLYTETGSITKYGKMVFKAMDIIPMDAGNSTYTEYAYVEGGIDRHADYCLANPEALGWKMGHVHSHNHMATFFSGTDMEELMDNSASHDHYLSLIVNNAGHMCAKLAFRGKHKTEHWTGLYAKNGMGSEVQVGKSTNAGSENVVFTADCDIFLPPVEMPPVPDAFAMAVRDIIAKREEKKAKREQPLQGIQKSLFGETSGYISLLDNVQHAKVGSPNGKFKWGLDDDAHVVDMLRVLFLEAAGEDRDKKVLLSTAIGACSAQVPKLVARDIANNFAYAYHDYFDDDPTIFGTVYNEALAVLEGYDLEYPDLIPFVIDELKATVGKSLDSPEEPKVWEFPVEQLRDEEVRAQNLVLDLFASAYGSTPPHRERTFPDVFTKAAQRKPKDISNYVAENYMKFFHKHYGDPALFMEATADIVFLLENFEHEHPGFLTETIEFLLLLMEKADKNGKKGG